MPIFEYSAAEQNGTIVKGEREAENEKSLAHMLRGENIFLIEAKEKQELGFAAILHHVNVGDFFARFKPVSSLDKMFFARNLSVMISAGLSLTKALDALGQESTSPKMRYAITDISAAIAKGKSFADALRTHQNIFGDLFINMVEVGETSGKLALILKLLARQLKKDHDLKSRVKGAMMYPAIVVLAVCIIGALMMIYVVPTLVQTIKDLGAPLPVTTQMIILLSDTLQHYGLFVLAGIIAFVYLFFHALKTQKGRSVFDHTVLRIPIFGELIHKFNIARFARTLAYLTTSGVPITHSLEITSGVLGNTLYRDAIKNAAVEIQKGKQLHQVLAGYPSLFNPLVLQMIGVGEETGTISSMLLRIAIFFEEDVNEATKNLSTLIEPILMIIIGSAVGFFVISILQPIYGSLGNL